MKNILRSLLMVTLCLFVVTGLSFAVDDSNRYRDDSSSVFSPGYLNAAKYQAESVINQQTPQKSLIANMIDFVLNRTANKTEQANLEKASVKPELKQKISSKNPTHGRQKQTCISTVSGLTEGNIDIGNGTDKRDANGLLLTDQNSDGRMVSEVIDGVKYVFIGFDTFGADPSRWAWWDPASTGDCKYIFKGGTYNVEVTLAEGESIYGGYYENGTRDIINNATTINGVINAYQYGSSAGSSTIEGLTIVGGISIRSKGNVDISYNNITVPGYDDPDIYQRNYCDAIYIYGTDNDGSLGPTVTLEHNNISAFTGIGVDGKQSIFMFILDVPPPPNPQPMLVGSYETITSQNNNYNTSYGFRIYGDSAVTSGQDYYAGNQLDSIEGGTVTVTDPSVTPNIVSYANLFSGNPDNSNNYQFTPDNPYARDFDYQSLFSDKALDFGKTGSTHPEDAGTILKNLLNLKNSSGGFSGQDDLSNRAVMAKILGDALSDGTLGNISNTAREANDTEIAKALANILSNPTEDQKVITDVLKALLKDTEKAAEDAAAKGNPELKKAQDDLLQAVANLLLAQAMPDLIKKGDIAGIKTMFSDLDTAKTKLMNDYAKSTRPYYDNMLKDLARNLAMLQLKNILNPNMSKDELEKLPPSELDKILEKIKQQKDKAFEEEYLLQQEAKYRKTYIDPNKQKLEEDMKNMLNDFTKKINGALK